MARRTFALVVLCAAVVMPACSTLGAYPDEWRDADNSIHVYGSVPTRTIELPADGQLTLLDAILSGGPPRGDLSRVALFRHDGAETMRTEVDVLDMLRRGETSHNVLLRPGDVVGIPD